VSSGENIPESSKAKHRREPIVCRRSMPLAKLADQLTDRFPPDERLGLTPLIRRTVLSIPSSIAKGQAGQGTRDFLERLSYALGDLAELATPLLRRFELGFCSASDVKESLKEIDELERMLDAIVRKLASALPLATPHSPFPQGEAKESL
jgi:four helix bundle protein